MSHCCTAFQTASQIVFIDSAKGNDDLLLCGIHHRHLGIRGHARYLCGGTFEPGFSGEMWLNKVPTPVLHGLA
jgi:hypothetical protein